MALPDDEDEDDDDGNGDGVRQQALQLAVFAFQQLLLQLHALIIHLHIAAGHHIAVRYQHDRVVDLLESDHLLVGFLVLAHTVVDHGHTLCLLVGREILAEAHRLVVVAVQDMVVHLYHRLHRADAVGLLQLHQHVVDAVVELLVVLVEGKLADAEQGSALVDGSHVGFCQYLAGILQSCLLVLAVVGNLHQLLQVVASALIGEIFVEEGNSLLESILGSLIVLSLERDVGFGVQGDIAAPEAVLVDGVLLDHTGYLLSLGVVLVGSLEDGLISPGFIEYALGSLLQAFFLQLLGDFHELFYLVGADKPQHLSL